jgi:hypothetical protein
MEADGVATDGPRNAEGQRGMQIMSKPKTTQQAAATTNIDVSAQLVAINKTLDPVVNLTPKARGVLENRSRVVPDALIQKMIKIATDNGGVVAGMPFDVDAANAALSSSSKAQAAADASRTIAQKLVDSAVQQRVVVADRTFAIYRALGRLVKTPEGNSLLGTYKDMAATVKNRPRIARKKKTAAPSATPAATPEPTPAPAPSPAPAQASAPANVAVPAASGASHS